MVTTADQADGTVRKRADARRNIAAILDAGVQPGKYSSTRLPALSAALERQATS